MTGGEVSRIRCSRATPCIARPRSSASANRTRARAPASSSCCHRAYNQDDKLVAECQRQAFMRMRPRLMRSLLFVPADSPRKLDKGMASGADALILDLEDSIAPERKAERPRCRASPFSRTPQPPRRGRACSCASTASTPASPTPISTRRRRPARRDHAAEGGGRRVGDASRRQAHGARGDRTACPTARSTIIAIATETAAALFLAGTYGGASPRLRA